LAGGAWDKALGQLLGNEPQTTVGLLFRLQPDGNGPIYCRRAAARHFRDAAFWQEEPFAECNR